MKLQFTLHQLVSIRKFYHESSLKGAYSDLFMCYFLLYIEAHHPNSLDLNLKEMASVAFILTGKMCIIRRCMNFGCGNHTFVEISHFFVLNI